MVVVVEVAPFALKLLCASHAAPAQVLGHIIRLYLRQMQLHSLSSDRLDRLQHCECQKPSLMHKSHHKLRQPHTNTL